MRRLLALIPPSLFLASFAACEDDAATSSARFDAGGVSLPDGSSSDSGAPVDGADPEEDSGADAGRGQRERAAARARLLRESRQRR